MIVEYRDGEVAVDEPVRDFHGAALKGCDECADFLGRSADISVGSVGSMDGWTSVLVRTERGRWPSRGRARSWTSATSTTRRPSCGSTSSTSGSPSDRSNASSIRRAALHRLRGAPAQLRGTDRRPVLAKR